MKHQLFFSLSSNDYVVVFSNGVSAFRGESNDRLLDTILKLYKLCFESVQNCNIFHNSGFTIILSFDDEHEMCQVGSELSTIIQQCRISLRSTISINNFDKLYIINYIEIYYFLLLFQYCKKKFTPFILKYKNYMEFVDPIIEKWCKLNGPRYTTVNVLGDEQTKKIITFCALAKAYNKNHLKTRLKNAIRNFEFVNNHNPTNKKLLSFIHDTLLNHPEVSDKFKTLFRQQRILEGLK